MRAILTFAVFLFFSITIALPQGRSVPVFKSGNWEGDAYYKEDKFRFCMITGEYRSGISVAFSLFPDDTWKLMFSRPEGFSSDVQQRLDLYVDGRFVFGASAMPVEQGLILTLPSDAALFHAMRVGHNLRVVTPGGSAGFNLTGTAAALAELAGCTARLSRPQIADTASIPRQPPAQRPAEPSSFSRDQVLTYAANVLAAGGVRNYQFLPYEETKELGDAVWRTEDGEIGAIIMMKNVPADTDVNALIANITQQESESCKGDLASGKKAPTYSNGTEITKSFAVCRAGKDSRSFEYTFMRMPNGVLVRFATGTFGAIAAEPRDTAQPSLESEKAFLTVALPR